MGFDGRIWRRLMGFLPFVFGALAVAAFSMGLVGFLMLPPPGGPLQIDDAIFNTLSLFLMELRVGDSQLLPLELNIARFLAPALTGYAVLQGALVLLERFHERMRRRRLHGHTVVCGLGQRGRFLILDRSEAGQTVAAIDSNPEPDVLAACKKQGISLITGNAADPSALFAAGILQAKEAFVFTRDDNVNLEIVHAIVEARLKAAEDGALDRLDCYLSISDLKLSDLIPIHTGYLEPRANLQIGVSNISQAAARDLWEKMVALARKSEGCLPLASDEKRRAHVVIHGFGTVGRAILFQLARLAHFANGLQTRVTLIDACLDDYSASEGDGFTDERLSRCSRVLDLKVIPAAPGSRVARQAVQELLATDGELLTHIVCRETDAKSLDLAIDINEMIRHADEDEIRVFVRLTQSAGINKFLVDNRKKEDPLRNLNGFGLFQETFSLPAICRTKINGLAQAIHIHFMEGNRSPTDPAARESWQKLPEYLKEANRAAAEHIIIKCLTVGCDTGRDKDGIPTGEKLEEQMEALARMEHDRWMADKVLQGFSYGELTDKKQMTHKCIVPWDKLSEEDKEKDRAHIRDIPKLMGSTRSRVEL